MSTDFKMKELIAKMILSDSYWGYLFSRIRRIAAKNFGSIMGVAVQNDSTVALLYDPDLFEKTDEKNLMKIIEHEGMHLLNQHLQRLLRLMTNESTNEKKQEIMKVWNVASDCAANEQAGIVDPINIAGIMVPPQLPKMYNLKEGSISEYYYYELLKQVKTINIKVQCADGTSIDSHAKWINPNNESDPNIISRKVEEYVRQIVRDSIKNFSNEQKRGKIPGNLYDLISKLLTPPELPYYQIIRKYVIGSRLSKFTKSFTRINRKRTYLFSVNNNEPQISPFPGRKSDFSFNIVILIDTSGSMSCKDIQEALKSIKSIIEKDRHCVVTVIENDSQIGKEYKVKRVKDIQFEVSGRGGTTLLPGLIRSRELKADITLGFTDGYCENLNEVSRKLLPKKLLWILTKGGTSTTLNKTGPIVQLK